MDETEKEARSLGWVSQDEFKGNTDRFISADEFLRRGKEVLPLLKATNRKLEEQVQRLQNALYYKSQEFDSLTQSVQELKDYQVKEMAERIKQERAALRVQLKEAREEGNVELEGQIEDRLDALKEQKVPAQNPTQPSSIPRPPLTQEYLDWHKENPWFEHDQRKTGLALGIGRELQARGITGKAFFAQLDKELAISLGEKQFSKTEGSSSTPSGKRGGGYDSLPPEAQLKCDSDAKKFVGKGKSFADLNSWREHYAKLYNAG